MRYGSNPSPSKGMARNCTISAAASGVVAGYVDMGLAPGDGHTQFSKNPNTSANAFVDFLYLMDALTVIRPRSSFSGTAVNMKDAACKQSEGPASQAVAQTLLFCQPRSC